MLKSPETLGKKIEGFLFSALILFIPTQLGRHFWPEFSIVEGIRIDYLSPTLYVTDVLIVLLFGFWVVGKVKEKAVSNFKFQISNFKYFFLVVLFLLLNILLSNNFLNGLYHLLKFLEFAFVAYYVATTIRERKQLQVVGLLFAASALFESSLAIMQYGNHGSIGGAFYFLGERTFNASTPGIANASVNGELILRPYGTLPHPNVLAGFLVVSQHFMLFSLGLYKEQWKKALIILALVVSTTALLLTLSRVAILLWIVGVLGGLGIVGKTRKKMVVIGISAIVVGGLILMPSGSRILQTTFFEEAVIQRAQLVDASFQMIQQRPLFGVGLGNFLPTLATLPRPYSPFFFLQPVHNIFLLVAAETGVIGLGVFIGFLVVIYRKLRAQMVGHKAAIPVLKFLLFSVVLILGLFDHYFLTLQQGQLLLSFILGFCLLKIKSQTLPKSRG